jgi:hypothetical protein
MIFSTSPRLQGSILVFYMYNGGKKGSTGMRIGLSASVVPANGKMLDGGSTQWHGENTYRFADSKARNRTAPNCCWTTHTEPWL